MNSKQRWLFHMSLVLSVLPFILIIAALKYLPLYVPDSVWVPAFESNTKVWKYENLFVGIFCILPLMMTLCAALLKRKGIIDRGFYSIIAGTTIINVAFLLFVIMCLGTQISIVGDLNELARNHDYLCTISCVIALVISFLSVRLIDLKPNVALGFRNYYTMSKNVVWERTHRTAGYMLSVSFIGLSMVIAFLSSWVSLVVLLGAMAIFLLIVLLISRKYYFSELSVEVETQSVLP